MEPFVTSREQVVAEALSWLGTPYHHGARLKGIGVDCAGLLIGVSKALGLKPESFDITGYPALPDGKTLKRYCDEHMLRIPTESAKPGDAVLLAWQYGPPQHLGILVPYRHGGLAMVHALGPRKPEAGGKARVLETRLVFGRAMQLIAAYSIPGVA